MLASCLSNLCFEDSGSRVFLGALAAAFKAKENAI